MGGFGPSDDHGPEAGRLIGLQVADSDQLRPVLIGPGEVGQKIVERLDAEGAELLGPGRTYAGQGRHGGEEVHRRRSFPGNIRFIIKDPVPGRKGGGACNSRRGMVLYYGRISRPSHHFSAPAADPFSWKERHTMPKTLLLLEGGAYRGIFTAGALDVFLERDLYFDAV